MLTDPKLVLIGAGKVATHLAKHWQRQGLPILQIWNRDEAAASRLANALKTDWSSDWATLSTQGDWYLLAVSDDALPEVVHHLSTHLPAGKLMLHTSGSTPATVFKPAFPRHGILYPLQSFTWASEPDWADLPLLINCSYQEDLTHLEVIARKLSPTVYITTDQDRKQLHLAAVFANNFTNHLFDIAWQICDESAVPFEVLLPLIRESVARLTGDPPSKLQTGPAVRGDERTINAHLEQLQQHPQWQGLYAVMSELIRRRSVDY